MSWFKIDDMFWSHPKVIPLSAGARGLWASAGAWASAYETDGRIPTHVVYMLVPASKRQIDGYAQELVTAGLWKADDAGWSFHDWLDWQPSAESLRQRRAADAERKRRGRSTQSHLRAIPKDG